MFMKILPYIIQVLPSLVREFGSLFRKKKNCKDEDKEKEKE